MHNIEDTLGKVIKEARLKNKLTLEQLADKLDISPRYLISIENENHKPSYDVFFKIVRELSIVPDLVFYPDKPSKDSEIEDLVRMLYNCDEHYIKVVHATVKALLNT